MGWNGMEDGMEWKAYFGMEDGKCQGWKGMEDLDDGMEDSLPSFHPNSIMNFLSLYHGIQKL